MKIGILPFAFGAPEGILSNRRIASIASKMARDFSAPVYTQLDICLDDDIEVDLTYETPGNPPSTLRFVRGAVQWARRKKITNFLVIAAKPHLWRCVRDLTHVIYEEKINIEINVCKETDQYPEDEWYCPDSKQDRTRSRKKWEKRERLIKIIPFCFYKLIAK